MLRLCRHRVGRGRYRPLAPLRTVRESFPSYGSSPSKADDHHRPGDRIVLTRSPLRYSREAAFPCGQRAHRSTVSPLSPFAFPLAGSSSCSLATKHPSDVGSLSCRVTSKPVSASLQGGLRFFRHLNPAPPWAHLTARFPSQAREGYGVSTFRF